MISDAVNLASRIEDMNKEYGTALIISKNTYDSLRDPSDYAIRRMDRVLVKGKSHPVHIYEVFDADPPDLLEGKRLTLDIFENALSAYENKQFDSGLRQFNECLAICPKDQTVETYVRRCLDSISNTRPLMNYAEKAGESRHD